MPATIRPPHDKYAPSAVKWTMSKKTMAAELKNANTIVHPWRCTGYPEMIPVSEKPRKRLSKTMEIPPAVERETPKISSVLATSQIARHNGATTTKPMSPILSRCLLGEMRPSGQPYPHSKVLQARDLTAAKSR